MKKNFIIADTVKFQIFKAINVISMYAKKLSYQKKKIIEKKHNQAALIDQPILSKHLY